MLVTSQCCGRKVTGIHVGKSNVQRYFPRNITEIELQLDHLRIECGLDPHFWNGKPEICDPRLVLWLESKDRNPNGRREPTPMALQPLGENCFVLVPSQPEKSHKEAHPHKGGAHEGQPENQWI